MNHANNVLIQTDFPELRLHARGKVRDIYSMPDQEALLFVATDRISAFDCVLKTGIPQKGRVLTQISLFWFEFLKDLVPNHVITAEVEEFPEVVAPFREQLRGRSMMVRQAQMFPVECVARGYLSGSGCKDYQRTGAICGIALPKGMRESERLPEPIFTPATKAASGHDENIPFAEMVKLVGEEQAEELRDLTLRIYDKAADYAERRGILIADTKFEFGTTALGTVLADEALTPDSSRFWWKQRYLPGGAQPSFDKQYVRDYLETLDWNKQPPAPALPEMVARRTSEKYRRAYEMLTGHEFEARTA
ncbi:MAG: phosphoribosylaminoimidazolesuccinocarboxamide synthase [Acidobacteriaceae bacterium]